MSKPDPNKPQQMVLQPVQPLPKEVEEIQEPGAVKDGKRSTEFWGKVIMQVILILNAVFDLGIDIDDSDAVFTAGALEGLYQTWRGAVKTRAAGPKKIRKETNQ